MVQNILDDEEVAGAGAGDEGVARAVVQEVNIVAEGVEGL